MVIPGPEVELRRVGVRIDSTRAVLLHEAHERRGPRTTVQPYGQWGIFGVIPSLEEPEERVNGDRLVQMDIV